MCSWELAGGEENFQKGALIQQCHLVKTLSRQPLAEQGI